jgi:hypothetical protein
MVEQVYPPDKSQMCGSWVSIHICLVCLNDVYSALIKLHTVQAQFVFVTEGFSCGYNIGFLAGVIIL